MAAYRAYDRIEDRRWVEQQLTDEKEDWIDKRAKEVLATLPKDAVSLFLFSVPANSNPREGLRHDSAIEAYNNLATAVAYAQAEHDWEHRTGCPF